MPTPMNFQLKSIKGVIHVLNDSGDLVPEFKDLYTPKEEFMEDFQYLQDLMSDGPLWVWLYFWIFLKFEEPCNQTLRQ